MRTREESTRVERKRVAKQGEMYKELKKNIPGLTERQRWNMTHHQCLLLAIDYIKYLRAILENEDGDTDHTANFMEKVKEIMDLSRRTRSRDFKGPKETLRPSLENIQPIPTNFPLIVYQDLH